MIQEMNCFVMKIMKMEDVLKIRSDLHLVRHITFYIISNKFDSPVGDTKIYIYKVTDRFLYNYWQSKQNYPKPKVRDQQIKYVLHGEYVNKLEINTWPEITINCSYVWPCALYWCQKL